MEAVKRDAEKTPDGLRRTVCQMCGYSMCGMNVLCRGGKIVEITPMKEYPFNRGGLCPKGYAAKELQHHPGRLTYPLRRSGDGWERVTWDKALDFIADRLTLIRDRYGPESLCVVTGDCKLNESEGPLISRFMNVFGTPNRVTLLTDYKMRGPVLGLMALKTMLCRIRNPSRRKRDPRR